MVTAATLNPCIDRTITLRGLAVGGHNRADAVRCDLSGKGINVCVVLRQCGRPAACVGFEFTESGSPVGTFLKERGIDFYGVDVPRALRVNIKLADAKNGGMTEINERGARVDPSAVGAVKERLGEALAQTSLLVVDGSVPPGVPETIYRDMISMASARGIKAVLDASGSLLREGLKAKPWAVKPNRYEMENLFGTWIDSREQAVSLCRRLVSEGVREVCLSLGAEGALLVTEEGAWFSPALDIPVKGRQGAGDSMVAGLCMAVEDGLPPDQQLRYAAAAAHGSLLLEGTLLCTRDDFNDMLGRVDVSKIC